MRIGPGTKSCAPAAPGEVCLTGVALQPLFVLQFDRLLASSSVSRANYHITSGGSGELVFKQIRVDPVERTVVFNIDQPLLASTEYKLTIKAADRPADRLAAFDGTPFEGTTTIRFTTLPSATVSETDIDPLPVDPCAAIAVLQGSCTGSACHGELKTAADAGGKSKLAPPAMGLSLVSNQSICATALGKSAVEVQLAEAPFSTGTTSAPFPYGLPLVAPGDSSRSFLLMKILLAYSSASSVPQASWSQPAPLDLPISSNPFPATANDLARHVPGAPMPHPTLAPDPGAQPYAPLSIENVRLLRAWIDRGAPLCGGASCAGAPADAGADATTSDAAGDAAGDASDAASDARDAASSG